MKKIFFSAAICFLSLVSCNNDTKREETVETPPPVEQPAAPAPVNVTKEEDGTTIKVNEEGVSYESKNGKKKSDIIIREDSSSVEIRK